MSRKVSPFAPDKTKFEKRIEKKHTKYLEGVVAGKTKEQAALAAGYSASVSRSPGSGIEKTISAKSAIDRYLPVEKIFGVVSDAMGANKVSRASEKGIFTDERVEVDHAMRLRSSEVAGKFRGMFTEKIKVETTESHILVLPDNDRLNPVIDVECEEIPQEVELEEPSFL